MSILDPFHAGKWVERLWILRDRIREAADGWQNAPHLPWDTADPKSGPVRFEAVGLDSRRNRSCSDKEFVSEILKQFTRSQESAFGCTFAASTWMYLDEPTRARDWLRRALDMDPANAEAYRLWTEIGAARFKWQEALDDALFSGTSPRRTRILHPPLRACRPATSPAKAMAPA